MDAAAGPVTQALLVIVGALGATIATAAAPAIGALVGLGTLKERRLRREAESLAPSISKALQESSDFEQWVKGRAAHALKSDISALNSAIQSMTETVKAHSTEVAALGKISATSAADIAYIRGRLEASR